FYGCTGLTDITIPDGLVSIGSYAFYNCTSLTDIIIPDSTASINNYAFCGCTGLTNAVLSGNLASIGDYAFYGCTSLTDLTLSDNLSSIDSYAFSRCKSLSSITIPKSVTAFGSSVFTYSGLKKVYCYEGSAAADTSLYPIGTSIYYLSSDGGEPVLAVDGSLYAYTFVVDRDMTEGMAEGETLNISSVTMTALQALSLEVIGESAIGSFTYTNALKSSSVNTSVSVDGTIGNYRMHSSYTASEDFTITIATKLPSGKKVSAAVLNDDGTYTSLFYSNGSTAAYTDGTSLELGNNELTFTLAAGQTVYLMGGGTNLEVYAVNVADGSETTAETTTESTTEAVTESTTETSDSYTLVVDRDITAGMAEGDTLTVSGVTMTALQALLLNVGASTSEIGDYTYTNSLKSNSVNTSVIVDGAAAANYRMHSSYTASEDCTITIAAKVPSGKYVSVAVLNDDGTYSSLFYSDGTAAAYADGTEGTIGNAEIKVSLAAGETLYLMGRGTNIEVYAVNVTSGITAVSSSSITAEAATETTTEAASETTTETETESVSEASNHYSYIVDNDTATSYKEKDVIYSDDYITYTAEQYLTVEKNSIDIGALSYNKALKSNSSNTSITLDGAKANYRIHSSITALQDCTITLVIKKPGINSSGSARTLVIASLTLTTDNYVTVTGEGSAIETFDDGLDDGAEVELNLEAGKSIYILGQGFNPYVYAVNAAASTGSTTTTEAASETTTETETESASEASNHYSYIVYNDTATSYEEKDVIYSDDYITYTAEQYLTVGNSSIEIGAYSYNKALRSNSSNTSITLDGTTDIYRIHSSITALQDCTVTIATRNSDSIGESLVIASLTLTTDSDGTVTGEGSAIEAFDDGLFCSIEVELSLKAGETVYILGQGFNPCIYAVNAAAESAAEETSEADSPYSLVVDRDLDTSDTYAAGDTVYSDSLITYDAVLKLSVGEGTETSEIGSYSYSNYLVCSSTTSSVTLDGTTKNLRIHSSITANKDCIVTIAATVPSGKEIAAAQKNSDGTYTSLAYYDGTESYGNVEIVLSLTEGQTVCIMGQAANPCIYAIDAISAGDANGNHTTELTDTIKILQYIDNSAALTKAELAACDINNDGVVDKKDAALVLKQIISEAN
ncbi:MAG: leucine-rich repeat protein, partial [Clostridiales bacterium]|nr:leucine-rich repeat protein [Clostridiales bacterium]